MKSRHRSREIALQILYHYDVPQAQSVSQLQDHFDHFQVPEEVRGFAAELVAGTVREVATLDQLIEKHAANWKVSRMALVDRSLLRMATYELLHFPDTAPSIVIDEAVELAKQFGTEDTPAFVNGVLDSIKDSIKARPTGETD